MRAVRVHGAMLCFPRLRTSLRSTSSGRLPTSSLTSPLWQAESTRTIGSWIILVVVIIFYCHCIEWLDGGRFSFLSSVGITVSLGNLLLLPQPSKEKLAPFVQRQQHVLVPLGCHDVQGRGGQYKVGILEHLPGSVFCYFDNC